MKTLKGVITSLKNQNTAIVTVSQNWMHPLYKKYVKRTKRYACDYQNLKLELDQEVTIIECKPVSKTKHFRVLSEKSVEAPKKKEPVAAKKTVKKTTKKAEDKKSEAKSK